MDLEPSIKRTLIKNVDTVYENIIDDFSKKMIYDNPDIDKQFKDLFREQVIAYKDYIQDITRGISMSKPKPRKKSAYQYYFSEKNTELKENIKEYEERKRIINEQWKTDKDTYKPPVDDSSNASDNEENTAEKKKITKKTTEKKKTDKKNSKKKITEKKKVEVESESDAESNNSNDSDNDITNNVIEQDD